MKLEQAIHLIEEELKQAEITSGEEIVAKEALRRVLQLVRTGKHDRL